MMLLSNMILLSNMMLYDVIYLFKFNNSIKLSNFCSIKRQIVKFEQGNTHWELLYSCSVK